MTLQNGPEPDHPVTLSSDLEGYWELVSIQLKEVHDTFAEIDKLRQNNWIDDTPPPQPPYISPPTSPVCWSLQFLSGFFNALLCCIYKTENFCRIEL